MNAMLPQTYRIRTKHRETKNVFTVELVPARSDAPGVPAFAPGQFNMLYGFGVGEAAISISGDSTKHESLVHTIRTAGSVTDALDALHPGDTVGLRGPFGGAWPIEAACGLDLILMAGGIGLAPLRPVLYHILNHRDDFERVSLVYGARSPDDLLYADELAEWRSRMDLDVDITVDTAGPHWHGNVGVVTNLLNRSPVSPKETLAMICGPEVMMRHCARELGQIGVREDRIYLSLERNMRCAIGQCGHCQYGPYFVCKNGPVFPLPAIRNLIGVREI